MKIVPVGGSLVGEIAWRESRSVTIDQREGEKEVMRGGGGRLLVRGLVLST